MNTARRTAIRAADACHPRGAAGHSKTGIDRRWPVARIRRNPSSVRHAALAAALWAACVASALAQAPSNPNLNAQLLVGARQADRAQVERTLAEGAVPNARNRL